MQQLNKISLVVNDYDEAITFYTETLGFELVEDTALPEQQKRWVVVKPAGSTSVALLLAKAKSEAEKSRIGNQTGGRVFLFLETDDFWRDYKRYSELGVKFVREPQEHGYGTVAVFEDLYGNLFDLIQTKNTTQG